MIVAFHAHLRALMSLSARCGGKDSIFYLQLPRATDVKRRNTMGFIAYHRHISP